MTEWHRPRGDDLLARRAAQRVHLLPARELLLLRGRGHDRGPAAALHRHQHRHQLRDTHRVSVVGFAFTELLGFRLLPRLKKHRLEPALPLR